MSWQNWANHNNSMPPKDFCCGFCGSNTGSSFGYSYSDNNRGIFYHIYICTSCYHPTFFDNAGNQIPGPLLGRDITGLPDDIKQIYLEIRNTIKNSCFTATILLGRKLIMHLAVDAAKSKPNQSFGQYIDELKSAGYLLPNADKWVDFLRTSGNEQSHEIILGTSENARKILKFIEVLLISIYEFPSESFENEQNQPVVAG